MGPKKPPQSSPLMKNGASNLNKGNGGQMMLKMQQMGSQPPPMNNGANSLNNNGNGGQMMPNMQQMGSQAPPKNNGANVLNNGNGGQMMPNMQQMGSQAPPKNNGANVLNNGNGGQMMTNMQQIGSQAPPKNNGANVLNNGNGGQMIPNMQQMGSQPPLMNFPNQLVPMQNNFSGMPNFGSMIPMQQMGFVPQNGIQNLNNMNPFQLQNPFFNMAPNPNQQSGQPFMQNTFCVPQNQNQNGGASVNANQANPSQPSGQVFPPNLNQNMGLQFGQFPMPNMNPFFPMQMFNPNQVGPCFIPSFPGTMFGTPNQGQIMGPLNQALIPNLPTVQLQAGGAGQNGNLNLQNSIYPQMCAAPSPQSPIQAQQSQGNSPSATNHLAQSQQIKSNLQHSSPIGPKGIHVEGIGNDTSKSNWNQSRNQNFVSNSKGNMSGCRPQNSQFHQANKANRQRGGNGRNGRKGLTNDKPGAYGEANSIKNAKVQENRPVVLNYTEEEIQLWREARKKNHPSKAEKTEKLTEKIDNPEAVDTDAKLRRTQLKEVLAKQAELGIEVAEVPRHYLLDSETPTHGGPGDDRNAPQHRVNDRFQNRRNKRGRYDNKRENRFTKKQKWENNNNNNNSSLNAPRLIIPKPSLLQKLLSSEINRDKSHLLQAFRFMVINNFFQDDPTETPLVFPTALVKGSGLESRVPEEESSGSKKWEIESVNDTLLEESDDDDDEEEIEAEAKAEAEASNASAVKEEGSKKEARVADEVEEEGEIID